MEAAAARLLDFSINPFDVALFEQGRRHHREPPCPPPRRPPAATRGARPTCMRRVTLIPTELPPPLPHPPRHVIKTAML